ncbi:unnamed protein product, partial [Dracunculus medinensis]|uniref:Nucleoside-diphosphatase mig-23 n=1 Tax=Dracunculus medinensis TaxID=318479 RepID=A0A0N4ULN1_DRAME
DWNYAVIIDAGSTGSRLYLYRFRSVSEKLLIDIRPAYDNIRRHVIKKINPGLSSFADNPENATGNFFDLYYLKPLLDYAIQFIPFDKVKFTSLFIFATAGMRLIPVHKQNLILKNLHENLSAVVPMQVLPEHIRVISGDWEGIYSWIAVNYVLGRLDFVFFSLNQIFFAFSFKKDENFRKPTVGIIDMGGGSVQIAVETNQSGEEDEFSQKINLGCDDNNDVFMYRLFVSTFLGFGVNQGLQKYENYMKNHLIQNNAPYVRDPCLPKNLVKQIHMENGSIFTRKGYGSWDDCFDHLVKLLAEQNQKVECVKRNCLLGMVRAPNLSLSNTELYGFSEYWFSMEDVLSLGGSYNFTTLAHEARKFCAQKWSTVLYRWRNRLYPKADKERIQMQCFKSAWISAILHFGFHVDKYFNNFKSVLLIEGQEVQWTLGALLYHLRYFPLRDIQKQRLLEKKRRQNVTNRGIIYLLPLIISVFALFVVWFSLRRSILRRERSMWGYMMLSQNDSFAP